MFDPLAPVTTFRSGRLAWLFPDGTVLPAVRGGDGPTLTLEEVEERLGRLGELSDEELAETSAAIQGHYDEIRGDGIGVSDEDLEALRDLAAARTSVNAEITQREEASSARADELAALDAQMSGESEDDDEDEDDGDDGTGEAPAGEEAGAEGEVEAPAAEPIAASAATPNRRQRRDLARLRSRQSQRAAADPASGDPFNGAVITASADVAGMAGQRIRSVEDFGRAFDIRLQQAMRSRPSTTPLPVMSVQANVPADLLIPDAHSAAMVDEYMDRAVARFNAAVEAQLAGLDPTTRAVLLAAGGPCVVRDRSFDVPFLADDSTPFSDSFPSVGYPRGGVEFYPPLCFDRSPSRSAAATGTTNTSPTITGTFTQADVGRRITGAGIPANTTIIAVNTAGTQATMSANATATASITATITGRSGNIGRVITAAQDLAGYVSNGGTTPDKACDRITCPTTVTCDLDQIVYCLTIGNWVDRTFGEWVRAWRQAVGVGYAATWEETHMNKVIAGSTLMTTGAAVFGATRDVLGRTTRMVEHITSSRRLPSGAMWRLHVPSWFVPYLKAELAYGHVDSGSTIPRVTDAELIAEFRERRVNLSTFRDESGLTANGSRSVLATPTTGVVPAFPTEVRTLLHREGAWVRGQGGTLDLSLIRDSVTTKTNDFQVFNETESTMCYRGCAGESFVVDHTVEFSGVASGLVDPGVNPT